MTDIQIYNRITNLPENLKMEVVDFIDFLSRKKANAKSERKRIFGYAKGAVKLKPGFDEIPADFNEYIE